jgi:hypothetical protein
VKTEAWQEFGENHFTKAVQQNRCEQRQSAEGRICE